MQVLVEFGSKKKWHFDVDIEKTPSKRFSFEAISEISEPKLHELFKTENPFEGVDTICGYADYQRPCTIIKPFITEVNNGSIGINKERFRCKTSGEFGAFLDGFQIDNSDKPFFRAVSFNSKHLHNLMGGTIVEKRLSKKGISTIKINKNKTIKNFKIDNIGDLEIKIGASSSTTMRTDFIEEYLVINLKFKKLKSLNEVMTICTKLETLFAFLIGFRGEFPKFHLTSNEKYELDSRSYYYSGCLVYGGHKYREDKFPHIAESLVVWEDILDFNSILNNYFKDDYDVFNSMQIIEIARSFSSNLLDIFNNIMPNLEGVLVKKFIDNDEETYSKNRDKFIEYIHSSKDSELTNFLKKNVKFVELKSLGLKQRLSKAITHINSKGFCIDEDFANRINKTRGKHFHNTASIKDVEGFLKDLEVATVILLLLTLEKLGLDISLIAKRSYHPNELRNYINNSGT